ncbi:MAG: macrocin-O-methyltransferase [Roseburia sp.]|nr:macrocin-O-methyltransferase [Roseburia sp.]
MKAIVFGATPSAQIIYSEIKKKYEIIAYCDNDTSKWGSEIGAINVISPKNIPELAYDEIIIISTSAMETIRHQLLSMGIPEHKINTSYVDFEVKARKLFVKDFSLIINSKNIQGCVAEAGVFQGEFAQIINESFPDRKLYLFDTFEGFDKRDIIYEEENNFSNATAGHLSITSETLVLNKMKYPEKCIIKKGYFPESAKGIAESFCYVNVDMDLYKPTLEALRFFIH